MNYINENNEHRFYSILSNNIYLWSYTYSLDQTFLDILETQKATGIEFKPSFNHDISRLPSCIKIIRFPLNSEFNQPIENLPFELEQLELYDKFNQPINCLPHGLKKLIINANFNLPIDELPAGLEYLEIRGCFNYSIDNLPIGLKNLIIKDPGEYQDYYTKKCISRDDYLSRFNQPIKILPPNLEVLEISHKLFNRDNIELYALNTRNFIVCKKYPKLHVIII